jgi:hypothetical protein
MIYDGMLLALDWEKGAWRLTDTIVPIMNAESDAAHTFGGYGHWPTRIVRYKGERYFVGGAQNDMGGTIWKQVGSAFQPIAHAGPFSPGLDAQGEPDRSHYLYPRLVELLGDKAPGHGSTDTGGPAGKWNTFVSYLLLWSDRNGDGIVQPEEATFHDKPHHWLAYATVGPDLSIYLRQPAHRGVTSVWRIPVKGFTPCGAPEWDTDRMETCIDRAPDRSPGGSMVVDSQGGMCVLANPIAALEPGTRRPWSRPNPWPHDGGGAPRPQPGLIVGGYGVVGAAELGGDAGTIFAVNSNFGQWYLLTGDGLYVGMIFGDCRVAPYWGARLSKAERGMDVNGLSHGQESFQGWFGTSSDGKAYAVAGHPHCSVMEVQGLESIRRIRADVRATTAQLAAAGHAAAARLAAARAGGVPVPAVSMWPRRRVTGASPLWHPLFQIHMRDAQERDLALTYLVYDQDALTVRFVVPQLENGAATPSELLTAGEVAVLDLGFSPAGGAADPAASPGDVRVLVGRVAGKPAAVLQRAGPADAGASAPAGVVLDATVTEEPHPLPDGRTFRAFTVDIPWKELTAQPPPCVHGTALRGDIGVQVRLDGTLQWVSWAGSHLGVPGDADSSARPRPALWGTLRMNERE